VEVLARHQVLAKRWHLVVQFAHSSTCVMMAQSTYYLQVLSPMPVLIQVDPDHLENASYGNVVGQQ